MKKPPEARGYISFAWRWLSGSCSASPEQGPLEDHDGRERGPKSKAGAVRYDDQASHQCLGMSEMGRRGHDMIASTNFEQLARLVIANTVFRNTDEVSEKKVPHALLARKTWLRNAKTVVGGIIEDVCRLEYGLETCSALACAS